MSSIISSLNVWSRDINSSYVWCLYVFKNHTCIPSSYRPSALASIFPFWIRCILWSNICSYSSKKEIISASQKSISLAQSSLAFVDVSTLKLLRIHTMCSEDCRPTAAGFFSKMTKQVTFHHLCLLALKYWLVLIINLWARNSTSRSLFDTVI